MKCEVGTGNNTRVVNTYSCTLDKYPGIENLILSIHIGIQGLLEVYFKINKKSGEQKKKESIIRLRVG